MKKNLYITTAIPYANAKPHIGNALDYLLADIWRRYQVQLGNEVRMQVGTDEHGNKIAAKAQAADKDPKSYVDETHLAFKQIMDSHERCSPRGSSAVYLAKDGAIYLQRFV